MRCKITSPFWLSCAVFLSIDNAKNGSAKTNGGDGNSSVGRTSDWKANICLKSQGTILIQVWWFLWRMHRHQKLHITKRNLCSKSSTICFCYSPRQTWIIERGCSSIIFCITVELSHHHQRAGASNWTARCHGNYAPTECGGFMKIRWLFALEIFALEYTNNSPFFFFFCWAVSWITVIFKVKVHQLCCWSHPCWGHYD